MFDDLNPDQKAAKNERTLSRIEIEFEQLQKRLSAALEALDLDKEDVKALLENEEEYSAEEFEEIQKQKAEMKKKIQKEIDGVEDAQKKKDTFAALRNIGFGSKI